MTKIALDLPSEVDQPTLKAFLRMYQFETWLREMVYLEMKANYGINWWNESEAALKRSRVGTHLPARYLSKDKRHSHISTAENDPLWFISFEYLLKIIFDTKHWPLFKEYFTTKQILRARFEEIGPIRNRVAHCRALHAYDVARLEQLMKDFDQNFWRFCTSYNDHWYFSGALDQNPVYRHFRDAACDWSDLQIEYSVRPSARSRKIRPDLGKGIFYHVAFISRDSRYINYPKVLKYTARYHKFVLHIMLDSFQRVLRITVPSTITAQNVIEVIERFSDACRNNYEMYPLVDRKPFGVGSSARRFGKANRPFEQIAREWPHYVVPPSHPYVFLDSGCPCSFFGVE